MSAKAAGRKMDAKQTPHAFRHTATILDRFGYSLEQIGRYWHTRA